MIDTEGQAMGYFEAKHDSRGRNSAKLRVSTLVCISRVSWTAGKKRLQPRIDIRDGRLPSSGM
jgi:hypothetical protein